MYFQTWTDFVRSTLITTDGILFWHVLICFLILVICLCCMLVKKTTWIL